MAIYKGDKKVIALYKGDKKIIKRYKGTQVVFDSTNNVADNCDGNTISFEFTGSSLTYNLDRTLVTAKQIDVTTSPYTTTLIDLGFNRLYPYNMFYDCDNLTSVSCLPNMETAVNSDSMFGYCSGLTSLDINDWVFKPKTCGSMFGNCNVLTSVTTNSWDMSECTNLSYMFNGCFSLSSIKNIKKWNVGKVTTMSYMFNACKTLTSIDLSGWNTSSATNLGNIFKNCSGLIEINLSGWNISKVTNLQATFDGCTNLQTLNLTGWGKPNISTPTYYDNLFRNCTSLNKLILGNVTQETYDWWYARLTKFSLQNQVTIEYSIV